MKNKYIVLALSLAGILSAQTKNDLVSPNENLIAENILPIPKNLNQAIKKYSESRNASVASVHPNGKEIIAVTRFASTNQLHKISVPMGARKQLTFFDEPVNTASYEPVKGEYLIYAKDTGGNEFGQLFKLDLKTMESTLLTDGGRSQNGGMMWKKDGSGFYFSSTKRNGGDRDVYYMNPSKPEDTQLILEVKGGGWGISDLSEDGKKLLITEYVSANDSYLHLYDLESKKLEPITDRKEKGVVQSAASFSKNPEEIFYVTDRNNEIQQTGCPQFKNQKDRISYLVDPLERRRLRSF
ncbi:MAG: hypothetical protein L0G05_03725 [Chryseobacterium sp.]|nr:hypothetical protein [Chryseobacterium sp.]